MTPGTRRTVAAVTVLGEAVLHAWLALGLTAVLVTAVWLWRLWRHPFGPCRSPVCRAGRNAGSDQAQWGYCGRCDKTPGGKGEEPRFGAAWLHPELRRK